MFIHMARTPESRHKENERRRARYANDPEYRARRKAEARNYLVHRRATDPEWVERERVRKLIENMSEDRRQHKNANTRRNAWKRRGIDITPEEWMRHHTQQLGCCFLCGIAIPSLDESGKKPNVDHCHECQDIRGLLCPVCNRALGLYESRGTFPASRWSKEDLNDYLARCSCNKPVQAA
ncbi:endonuclease domain-containing protein [Mycobacteroides abscessus]|uniref:endonuclease domain-containing protein n=1 Tax=Mycobacteroides abscessus TaxID=36809 RepID=UPI000C2680EA